MSLMFPIDPSPGQEYPIDATAYDIRYKYDANTNSWNIIGPDNVATIDYVDNAVNNNNKNIRRNYDLHQTTNVLTLNDGFAHILLDSALPEHSRTSLLTELYEDTSSDPPTTSQDQQLTKEEVAERSYTLEEWFYRCYQKTLPQTVDFFSYELETINTYQGMTNVMPDIMGIWVDGQKIDGTEDLDGDNFEVGSIIELKNILSEEQYGFDDNQYGLYKIVRKETEYVEDLGNGQTNTVSYGNGVGLGVVFLYSYTGTDQPNQIIQAPNASTQNYKLVSYLKSLDKTGGEVTGKLHVIYDSEDTFTVRKDEETDETLIVDTTNNDLLVNEDYNDGLLTINTDHDLRKQSLATVEYVNTRVGLNNIYDNTDNGPFVRINGSTMRGPLIIDNTTAMNGANPFKLVGKPEVNGPRVPVMKFVLDGGGDRVDYFGYCTAPYELVNRLTLKTEIDDLESNMNSEFNKYVPKSGGQVSGHIYVTNSVMNTEPTNNQYTPYYWVKDITVTKVLNNPSDSEIASGQLYEKNGSLYYYSYR